jgi:hypothetical protein
MGRERTMADEIYADAIIRYPGADPNMGWNLRSGRFHNRALLSRHRSLRAAARAAAREAERHRMDCACGGPALPEPARP